MSRICARGRTKEGGINRGGRALLWLLTVWSISPALRASSITPQRIWHVDGDAIGIPAAAGHEVYFLTRGQELVSVDAGTGRLPWRSRLSGGADRTQGSTVLAWNDLAIAGEYDIVAVDRKTGQLRWRFAPADGYGPGIYLCCVSNGVVFAGSPAGAVYAVDARTGRIIWTARVTPKGLTATVFWPATASGRVIAGYTVFSAPQQGGFVAWDAASGRELWRYVLPAEGFASGSRWAGGPLMTDRDVVVTGVSGGLIGLDPGGGRENWVIRDRVLSEEFALTRDFRALAASGSIVVAGSVGGTVAGYDPATRQRRWIYQAGNGGSVGFRIGAKDSLVFIPYMSGQLVALRVQDGTEAWRLGDGSSGYLWPPAFDRSGLLLVGSRGLSAYGLRRTGAGRGRLIQQSGRGAPGIER